MFFATNKKGLSVLPKALLAVYALKKSKHAMTHDLFCNNILFVEANICLGYGSIFAAYSVTGVT
jgi:hypothetical protein